MIFLCIGRNPTCFPSSIKRPQQKSSFPRRFKVFLFQHFLIPFSLIFSCFQSKTYVLITQMNPAHIFVVKLLHFSYISIISSLPVTDKLIFDFHQLSFVPGKVDNKCQQTSIDQAFSMTILLSAVTFCSWFFE